MSSDLPSDVAQGSSTRPYLIRALHEWCTDNGFTPYLAVHVDAGVQVPMEYVKNHEIVLNVGFEATSSLNLGNEFIEFKARFGGVAREILVPVDHVVAIYARENGQGMAFPMPTTGGDDVAGSSTDPVSGMAVSASASAKPAPSRGLRLAAVEGATPPDSAAEAGGVAAPVETVSTPSASGAPDEPPPASPPPGARPALKRVK